MTVYSEIWLSVFGINISYGKSDVKLFVIE